MRLKRSASSRSGFVLWVSVVPLEADIPELLSTGNPADPK